MAYVEGISTMNLFVVNCPTHGLMPVGFFHQLPYTVNKDKREVTVDLACHHCGFKSYKTYHLVDDKPLAMTR